MGIDGAALMARLPQVAGRYEVERPLSELTWFRVGGPAEVLFVPADEADLTGFFKALPDDIPVTVIGVGSNLLVRDGGIPGVVIRLGRGFGGLTLEGDHQVRAGAMAPDVKVAKFALQHGIEGLTFLRGIPGTIGGALRMNAGAHGGEIKDVLIEARAVDRNGNVHVVTPEQLDMRYRHTATPRDWVFTSALLRGQPGDKERIAADMAAIQQAREAAQPIRSRTGGSTFKNPPGEKAWRLIDAAGLRGVKVGGARVSTRHCNFLINEGEATAADIEALGELVRARVRATSGVRLEWEIRRLGLMAGG
ncbi:MAG TPA: UDP-N-acetylmuramate dehydrogenase [Thermopetrobacter sp.]|nr:UDP-N-acetylmuramate dehydrogenase [Thermopetrobacter sp.]